MARGISDVLSIYLDPKPTETKDLDPARAQDEPHSPDPPPQSAPPRHLVVPLDPRDLLEPILTWNLAAVLLRGRHPLRLCPYWVDSSTQPTPAPTPTGDAILLWLHASASGLERAQRRLSQADPNTAIETIVYGDTGSASASTWHRRLRIDRRGSAPTATCEMRCQGALWGGVEVARSLLRGRPVFASDDGGAVAASLADLAERLTRPAARDGGDA